MKKIVMCVMSLVLCVCMIIPSASAAAKPSQADTLTKLVTQAPLVMARLTAHFVETFWERQAKLRADPDAYHKAYTVVFGDREFSLLTVDAAFAALCSLDFSDIKRTGLSVLTSYINCLLTTLLDMVADYLAEPDGTLYRDEYVSEGFMPGHASFIDSNPSGRWSLGYAQEVITPDDLYTKAYYMGGFNVANRITDKYDDIKVRTVVLDDGSGRGKVAFSVVDAIGICNADVRRIRDKLADFARQNNIVSINVGATHCHSCIDTQGIWSMFGFWARQPLTLVNSLFSPFVDGVDPMPGVDTDYLESIFEKTAKSVRDACAAMETGVLDYCVLNAPQYFSYRKDPLKFIENIYKLTFTPDDARSTPTIIANFGAHPEAVGLKTDDNPAKALSGDFVPYIERVVNGGGCNFMFLQGAVGSMITTDYHDTSDGLNLNRYGGCVRYGEEIGFVLLGMGKTEAQCLAEVVDWEREDATLKALGDAAEGYKPWYEGWEYVPVTRVEPILNIAVREIIIAADNPAVEVIGKVKALNNLLLKDRHTGEYYTVTEVGYLEIGEGIRVLMSPGETVPELVIGGVSLGAENSVGRTDFEYDPLEEYIDGCLLVFDVMNDAIGYIMPDNDYGIVAFRWLNGRVGKHANGLLFSIGEHTASTLIENFLILAQK